MPFRFRLPLVALALTAPAVLSAQSAQDFQLPPNPTPTATPRVQGPVDTESGAVPVRPRAIGTPSPTPAPAPRSTATVQPVPTPSPAAPSPASQPRPAPQPSVTPRREPTPLPTGAERPPVAPGETAPLPVPTPTPTLSGPVLPTSFPSAETTVPAAGEADQSGGWLLPTLGGAGLLVLLGGGIFLWQRRRAAAPPPEIERPVVANTAPLPTAPDLQLRAEAIKLTRSIINATLQYRVTLINRSSVALSGVAVGADLVSAHGEIPVEQQVANAAQVLEKRHTFDRIAPGQSVRFEGNLQIPLAQTRIIRQGSAALFVPLLRMRVDGAGEEPLVRTFVVGQGASDGGRVTPFRIDEGPRSYAPIAARALD